MMKLVFLLLSFLVVSSHVSAAPVVGDTQGKVDRVVLRPYEGGAHRMRIYLKDIENDRFGCFTSQAQGYMETRDSLSLVSHEQFKMMLSMVMAAQMAGKTVTFDSLSSNSCNSVVLMSVLSE